MDMITLAMAKAYSDSKGGYVESYEIEWDGNTEGREVATADINGFPLEFYKVSSKILTSDELVGATVIRSTTDKPYVLPAELVCDSSELGFLSGLFLSVIESGMPLIVSAKAVHTEQFSIPSDGTYFLRFQDLYVTHLSKETVHPIDPKYLPGLEIDLADYGVDVFALFAQGGGTATIQDQAKFAELVYYNSDVPITFVIKNSAAGIEVKAEAAKTSSSSYINGLTATIPLHYLDKYYVAYLWVSGLRTVKLSVTVVN